MTNLVPGSPQDRATPDATPTTTRPGPAAWSPPAGLDLELQRTGVVWDAVRVSDSIGGRALARLGARNGAVIRDPQARALYWLVEPGTADGWGLADVIVLGVACWVGVPPGGRTRGPSPHWEIPPTSERCWTEPVLLRTELAQAVVASLLCPAGACCRCDIPDAAERITVKLIDGGSGPGWVGMACLPCARALAARRHCPAWLHDDLAALDAARSTPLMKQP